MKKKVRVYKPGGEAAQPTQEQIVNYIAQRMSSDDFDGDTDTLKDELAQAGIDEDTAEQYIEYVNENLGLSDQSETVNPEDAAASAEQEQARMEEEQALLEEQQAAEEQARQEQLNAMYNTDMDMSATEDTAEDEESYMQYGGTKPSKRSFINKYTKLAKKEMGGDATNHTQGPDTKPGTDFLRAVSNTAQDAILKQEAEQAYNSIYGAPQVGAFQDGGIHQEEMDPENPYHHLGIYSNDTRGIFLQNQNIQNDAPQRQFGGFTDTNSGLYRFIGGGDNVSADEEYQDADLNYQQYVKRGGVLNKYQEQGETTEDWKAKYDVLSKDLEAQKAKQDMIEKYMMQQYTGQQQPTRVRNPIISRGQRYNQAVSSPYYTATGERLPDMDFNKLKASSIHVDKLGRRGKIKEFTINYGDSSGSSRVTPEIKMPEERSNRFSDRANSSQPLASWMMNTNIPGIRGIGASLYNSGPYREMSKTDELDKMTMNDPEEIKRVRERIPSFQPIDKTNNFNNEGVIKVMKSFLNSSNEPAQPTQSNKPVEQANQIQTAIDNPINEAGMNRKALNYDYGNDPAAKAFQNKYPAFAGNARAEDFWSQQQQNGTIKYSPEKALKMKQMGLNPDIYGHHYLYENPDKFKQYGGPIDYTEYAYGGNISVPELYTAQVGIQVPLDPNENNMSLSNLTNYFTEKKEGDPGTLPQSMQPKTYTVDPNQVNPEQQAGVSQKFKNKSEWNVSLPALGDSIIFAGNMFENLTDSVRANRQQNQLLENTTAAETNYGINNQRDKGDYDPNSGLFRPDKMGAMQSKYGGGVYADGGNTIEEDEDVQYMTQEEIDDFIANGGELEYL
jgi:hypothetical protein